MDRAPLQQRENQTKKDINMETALFGRVTRALQKSPYLDFSSLSYETREEGNVVLRGLVPSYFEKQMAQESLRSVEGICEIVNELEVMGRSLRWEETS
jgi:osmotically-inducible protein OsmY